MQLQVSGRHLEITSAINEYVADKFTKLERHSNKISSVNTILSIDKLVHHAEATVRFDGGEVFATADCEDMYAAIDQLTDKLDRQIIKQKEKRIGRLHGNGSR
ncbi:MAG: ribosomal subunit interface protein [Gammaproteobacteria bacterium]|nr:MAG: ribosomal subunit interface protein [Gammaproteobacteria bacterium]